MVIDSDLEEPLSVTEGVTSGEMANSDAAIYTYILQYGKLSIKMDLLYSSTGNLLNTL